MDSLKLAYKKLQGVDVQSIDEDIEANSSTSIPYPDLYTRPSVELNGSVTYLANLEDAPQGRHLGVFSTLVLFVSRILGSGFLGVSSGLYEDCGRSPFYFFLAWLVAATLAFAGLYVFLELGSLLPRSGGTKVFIEFIYDKPYMFSSVVFLIYSIVFGFTLLNILVFGEYFLHAVGITPTEFRTRLTGIVFLYSTALIHGLSVNHGVKVQNFIGILKLGLAATMVLTGIYSLLPSSITHLESNLHWKDFFAVKTSITSSSFSSAVIRASFAYGGWNSVHSVANEIKDPVRTFKIAGPLSLLIITVTYIFTNIAYLIVLSDAEVAGSGKLIGSVLFQKVFGDAIGKTLLTLSAAVCAGGNVFVVLYTISRVSQEVFREGYFPFSQFMASNWPGDGPFPTLILSCTLTTLIVVLAPGKDIYDYIVALESYPNNIFIALVTVGVFIIRRRHPDVKAPIRTSVLSSALVLLITCYLIISPLVSKNSPNPRGLESWPAYPLVSIGVMIFCILYWSIMFKILPAIFGYYLVPEEIEQKDGLVVKEWVKVRQ